MEWRDSRRPKTGELCKKKKSIKREVRIKINELKSRMDCQQLELVDEKFREHVKTCFHTPRESKPIGSRLLLNGEISISQNKIITAWSSHFECLSKSRVSES